MYYAKQSRENRSGSRVISEGETTFTAAAPRPQTRFRPPRPSPPHRHATHPIVLFSPFTEYMTMVYDNYIIVRSNRKRVTCTIYMF